MTDAVSLINKTVKWIVFIYLTQQPFLFPTKIFIYNTYMYTTAFSLQSDIKHQITNGKYRQRHKSQWKMCSVNCICRVEYVWRSTSNWIFIYTNVLQIDSKSVSAIKSVRNGVIFAEFGWDSTKYDSRESQRCAGNHSYRLFRCKLQLLLFNVQSDTDGGAEL